MWDRLNRCRLYLEYSELFEQTRIMVCSICIPINMLRVSVTDNTWQAFPFERTLYFSSIFKPGFLIVLLLMSNILLHKYVLMF